MLCLLLFVPKVIKWSFTSYGHEIWRPWQNQQLDNDAIDDDVVDYDDDYVDNGDIDNLPAKSLEVCRENFLKSD